MRNIVSQLDESFPGIDRRPGVCGGDPCIVRMRIPVWLLVETRQQAASEADILMACPIVAGPRSCRSVSVLACPPEGN